jgi:uncharacterized membrane protein YfcA
MTEPVILAGSPLFYALLAGLGILIGAYGTTVGIGGGVILVPLLMFLYPAMPPEILTGISLAVVFLNALSGTVAYSRQRCIDYRNGIFFALATVPATVLGVWVVRFIPINTFAFIFGLILLIAAAAILFRPQLEKPKRPHLENNHGKLLCEITDSRGRRFIYYTNRRLGMFLSFFVGFLSGVLGIGGGVIHMPVLVYILNFPVHIATATSHFILVFTTLTGILTHLAFGASYLDNWPVILFLALGVIPGAQLGAWLGRRLHGLLVIRLLALALVILGVRLVLKAI